MAVCGDEPSGGSPPSTHSRATVTGWQWVLPSSRPPPPAPQRRAAQVRYLTRTVTPGEAVRRAPETCPMYYMGDRRTGRQLLDDFEADAASQLQRAAPSLPPATPLCGDAGGGIRVGRVRPPMVCITFRPWCLQR